MKTYKTWEAIKVLTENSNVKFKTKNNQILLSVFGEIGIVNIEGEYVGNYNLRTDMEWTLVQEPVTFEEVLNFGKNCRVEHKLIDIHDSISLDGVMKENWRRFCNGEYLQLGSVLALIGWMHTCETADIIKEGKWYIEEV